MTGFHQQQAISTLTAPGARGLSPHSLVQPDSRRALRPATEISIQLKIKMAMMLFQKKNITITIPKQHSDEGLPNRKVFSVGLPTHISNEDRSCLLREFPNDWLSPTDLFLDAHGIGQCGALDKPYPIPLLSNAPGEDTVTAHSLCSCLFNKYDNTDLTKCQYIFPPIHNILQTKRTRT